MLCERTGKTIHATAADAAAHVTHLRRRFDRSASIYHCPSCGHYHISTQGHARPPRPYRRRQRIARQR
jgi:hypothetical protein